MLAVINDKTLSKIQALPQPLSKEVVIATKGVQHIKVKQGYVYELSIKDKDGEVLRTDFDLIARKVGSDLKVLLEKDIIVIFDNYFEVCKIDIQSSCIISLPIKDGYHLDESSGFIDHNLQIVYSYDGERTLLNIVRNQEGVNQFDSFEQSSFNPAYLWGLLGLSGAFSGGGGGDTGGGGTTITDPKPVNTAPVFTAIDDVSTDENNPFTFTIPSNTFTDADGDALTYTATLANGDPLPAWLNFDASTGAFSGTPLNDTQNDDTGAINVVVHADDGTVTTDSNAFTITVVMIGTSGNDTMNGKDGNDTMNGKGGNDTIYGGDGNDTIYGGDGIDVIYGNDGNDTMDGGDGNDTIWGGDGIDQIYGGGGNDRLHGGEGIDTLTGGAGKDTFNYTNIDDGNDMIVDFKTGADADADVLNLAVLLSYQSGDVLGDFFEIIDDNNNTTIKIDANGDGNGYDVSITLLGVTGVNLSTMISDGNLVLM